MNHIMQVCHWKAHNTFTNFYLKDLTWSDDNNMWLGPVVVYSSLERKEVRGGGTSAAAKSPGAVLS